jgi:hypothetical protein
MIALKIGCVADEERETKTALDVPFCILLEGEVQDMR